MEAKNNDYTGGEKSEDVFANFRCSSMIGVHPVKGILMRMLDKVQRINSFVNDGQLSVPDETVADACEDIVNYAILSKALLQEERKKKSPTLQQKTSALIRASTKSSNEDEQTIKEQIL
tara:strand:+ start:7469 stop:7825 length:357 start_codon:yes stop_codon:yes gene_type:complete